MHLLIGGDLVPTQSNQRLFIDADVTSLLGEELLSIWKDADLRIFNLEAPLLDQENPIVKCGPNLIAPTSTINGIKQLHPDLITLANNHILDHGAQGLDSTIKVLNENGIEYVGAGANLKEAVSPYMFERNGLRTGIYACAEHEFTIAAENTSGANPFDPLESLDHIMDLKSNCEYVIVLYHGGKEHYRYPSPYLQKVCRKMIDKGADLVVCQHSHCIGATENYSDGTIVYGQGNFLFDHSESEFWQTSLLLDVTVADRSMSSMSVEYIPIVKHSNVIRLADNQQSEEILQGFNDRSRQILDEGFVQQEYGKYAAQMLNGYLETFHGRHIISRIQNKLFNHKRMKLIYSDNDLITIQNILECEAHRELMLAGLKLIQLKSLALHKNIDHLSNGINR
ncbi:MAG: CapA family protein [Burkholderiales bacterium]|nr:CapA family protein [Burkholderiales bacterium]